jgi:hypothetical protein
MIHFDTKAFAASMAEASKQLSVLVVRAVGRTAEMAAAYAKVSPLYKFRTGALRSSIQHGAKAKYSSFVVAGAKHARWVEEGTKPHVIRPRRKKWLRFEQNGAIRFSKKVHHPGTKPRPFMQRARDKVEPLFERLCVEAVDRMFG